MRYSTLLLVFLSGCAITSAPCIALDAGAAPDDAQVQVDAQPESETCAAYHTAVTARASRLSQCAPNFRCPCATRPIADSCFDQLNGAFTCDQLDAALAACGAMDDQTPVCP